MARDDFGDSPRDDDRRDPPRRPARDDFGDQRYDYAPPRAGMSGGMKLFLILLAIMMVCGIACCGGIAYFVWSIAPEVSDEPAKVDATRAEIATITLLPGFKPEHSMRMNNFMFGMKAASYKNEAVHGQLVLMQFNVKMPGAGQNEAQVKEQMRQSGINDEQDLVNSKSELKEIKVRGVAHPFEFTVGEHATTKKQTRQVTGSFQGKDGTATLLFSADADAYTEEQVIKMIEGIQ